MSTRLLFIRHGATRLAAEDRFAGSTNVALSDEGLEQARCLGVRLAEEAIDAIYASPLDRTIATAEQVRGGRSIAIETRDGLREISHGRWEGHTRAEVEAKFSEEYASWEEDPYTFAPEGGESGLAVAARALPVIRDIVLAHEGKVAAIVSHKATIRLILCSLLGIDPRGYRDRLDQAPACLNVLDFQTPVRARLVLYNDVSHYAKQPRKGVKTLSKWIK